MRMSGVRDKRVKSCEYWVMMAQIAQGDESTDVLDLPQDVIDALPDDIREEIISGARDQIPENVVEQMTPDLADQIPDSLVSTAADNPGATALLIVLALLFVAATIWGIIKGFIKLAIVAGLVAAALWFFVLGG